MFKSYYDSYSSEFIHTIQSLNFDLVRTIQEEMEQARVEERQLFVIGNGGSATSATHWACDFGKGVNVEGNTRFRVQSLTDNTAWMTALGNDISYEDIFLEQLKNVLKRGDLVIGLSVSGNSENVVRAFRYAKEQGAKIIAIVGAKEGKMKELADIALVVPSEDYGIVEDVHMFVNHVISQYLRRVYLETKAAAGN
ncbi:hypothetical protein SD70_26515 [Gordoniibacillus kamchatkensis]|uniref:SIS domain-containing protein n=1 Tax=Gordoniibacillus kamchatkensis TaxID=1590651 RepID=A0ABR5ABQ5_9BACL|nr:SIS domain-containing protein [Paenibacillus sp. VKM B-2647]KIL38417.1 hypothetical protein SD70_26515 [Paenibacillus sp. VKM B-2647]